MLIILFLIIIIIIIRGAEIVKVRFGVHIWILVVIRDKIGYCVRFRVSVSR